MHGEKNALPKPISDLIEKLNLYSNQIIFDANVNENIIIENNVNCKLENDTKFVLSSVIHECIEQWKEKINDQRDKVLKYIAQGVHQNEIICSSDSQLFTCVSHMPFERRVLSFAHQPSQKRIRLEDEYSDDECNSRNISLCESDEDMQWENTKSNCQRNIITDMENESTPTSSPSPIPIASHFLINIETKSKPNTTVKIVKISLLKNILKDHRNHMHIKKLLQCWLPFYNLAFIDFSVKENFIENFIRINTFCGDADIQRLLTTLFIELMFDKKFKTIFAITFIKYYFIFIQRIISSKSLFMKSLDKLSIQIFTQKDLCLKLICEHNLFDIILESGIYLFSFKADDRIFIGQGIDWEMMLNERNGNKKQLFREYQSKEQNTSPHSIGITVKSRNYKEEVLFAFPRESELNSDYNNSWLNRRRSSHTFWDEPIFEKSDEMFELQNIIANEVLNDLEWKDIIIDIEIEIDLKEKWMKEYGLPQKVATMNATPVTDKWVLQIIQDFKCILFHDECCMYLWRNQRLFTKFLKFSKLFHGMFHHKRLSASLLEAHKHFDRLWQLSVTYDVHLQSLNDNLMHAMHNSYESVTFKNIIDLTRKHLIGLLCNEPFIMNEFRFSEPCTICIPSYAVRNIKHDILRYYEQKHAQLLEDDDDTYEIADYCIALHPFSMCIPIHRYFATYIVQYFTCDSLRFQTSLQQIGLSPKFAQQIMEHPLRCIVFEVQSKCNLWRRNGAEANNMAYHYRKSIWNWCSYDLDLLLIQMCSMVIKPQVFIESLITKFNLELYFDIKRLSRHAWYSPSEYTGNQKYSDFQKIQYEVDQHAHELAMDFFLLIHYLCSSANMMFMNEKQRVEREIIHFLSVCPLTYTAIEEKVNENIRKNKLLFDASLENVADYHQPIRASENGIYTLKNDYWLKCDRYFNHFKPDERHSSIQRNQDWKRKNMKNIKNRNVPQTSWKQLVCSYIIFIIAFCFLCFLG